MNQPDSPNRNALLFAALALFIILPFWLFFLVALGVAGALLYKKYGAEIGKKRPKIIDIPSPSSSFSLLFMPTFTLSRIITGVVTLLALFLFIDGFVSVPAGSVAVIYDRGRGVLSQALPEGLHLKIPFWQVSTIMDTRLQAYTMSVQEGEGNRYGTDAVEALTSDGQKIQIDATVQFRVPAKNAPQIYQQIGPDFMEKVIRPGARSIIRDTATGYESKDLFTEKTRIEASQKMEKDLKALYSHSGLELDKLLLRNVTFSETYISAIEEKQVAQQKIQKAEYEKQEATIRKEKRIIEAEAEAQAIRLKGDQLRANPEVIQFQFVEKMAPNISWGILPSGSLPLLDLKSVMNNITK